MIAQQIQIPSNVFYQIVCCIVFVSVELASPVGLELVVSGRGKAEKRQDAAMLGATILPKYFSAAANSGIHALSYNSDSRSSKEDGGRGTGKTRKFKKVPFQKDKHCVTGQKILDTEP